MGLGILMYGPPAAGKDTVTKALTERDARYRQFRRLKAGQGRTAGYRMVGPQEVDRLRANGDIVWENQRYGATYYIDRPSLARELSDACPVVHIGQAEAISAVAQAFPKTDWVVVYLWCPREVAMRRAIERGTGDVAERMAAWDATEPVPAALTIDTASVRASDAAAQIDSAVRRLRAGL